MPAASIDAVQTEDRTRQLAAFRTELIRQRDAIRASLVGSSSLLGEECDYCGDEADMASTLSNGQLSDAIMMAEALQLDSLNDALARFAADGFGDCADCGDSIPLPRLEAIPHAIRCLGCQAALEAG